MKSIVFLLLSVFSMGSALAAEPEPKYIQVYPGGDRVRVDCPVEGGDVWIRDELGRVKTHYTCPPPEFLGPQTSSWKDEFRLQASLLAGGQLNGGHVTSAQLAFSWFPGGGTNGLRFFGGVGHSFAPFHFMYGLAYEHMPKRKHWSLSLGLASQNMKSEDYRLDSTGLDIPFDLRFKFSDPFSLVFQGHFGVTWNEEGVMSELVSGMVGLGIDFW